MQYVTYDEIGNLTGAYSQQMPEEHRRNSILVTNDQYANWTIYCADTSRQKLILINQSELPAINLRNAKIAKNKNINEARLNANFSYFEYQGKKIATDILSRSDIDGTNGTITLTGQFPQGWPGKWKTVENEYVQISNIEEWESFYLAFSGQGLINFAKSQSLKAKLESASTIEEVNSIQW